MKNVVLLGSTGSIGTSTLKVADDLPDQLRIIGLAAGNNAKLLLEQSLRYKPAAVCVSDPAKANDLQSALGTAAEVHSGNEGLIKLATMPAADIVLIAIVGTAGLQPALAAIRAGKDIAVASKEILVMAGEIVMNEARQHGVRVLAVDSEHSAIFQCLDGKPPSSVRKLWLTASGGPFRDAQAWPKEKFPEITIERALKHPSWVMGRKITLDSATLFNKGLEMIEARWLFDIEIGRVEVVVHPQSVVHSRSSPRPTCACRSNTRSLTPNARPAIACRRTSQRSDRSPSNNQITTGSPRSVWRDARQMRGAPCPPCSTRPTKLPWTPSATARSPLIKSRNWCAG
jgi:1-deoxy-D-xylulose-5-phosphate reductoisomerase